MSLISQLLLPTYVFSFAGIPCPSIAYQRNSFQTVMKTLVSNDQNYSVLT